MAKMIIIRNTEYVNRLRAYRIYLDEVKIGQVGNGEAKEFIIPAGKHQVCAKINWYSSATLFFEVSDQETRTYQVGNFRHSNWLIPLSIAVLILHFLLSFTLHFKYTIFLLVPAFAVLIYYMTLGYKKYLSIKEF